jgi:phosphoribosylformylglycinamidine synthase
MARPGDLDALASRGPEGLSRPRDGQALRDTLLALLGSPDLADKSWVTQQYDSRVRGNTVLAMPEDGGLIRVDEETGLGIALATDGNGRYCRLDPYAGTQLALAEAYRNVAMTGAEPIAVTNCLNFGSPEDPQVMWQLAEAVRGLADGCKTLGIPVTGGNVSLYNQTGASAIHPTPVIGVLGVHPDVRTRLAAGFAADGARVVLLGRTREEFGGSAWADVVHRHLGGRPPAVNLPAERNLAALIASAASAGVLASAHDLSDGGLAVALAEACLRGGRGCLINLAAHVGRAGVSAAVLSRGDPPGPPGPADAFAALFSESAARAIVSVSPGHEEAFAALCTAHEVPATTLGVTGGDTLTVDGTFEVPLDELTRTWQGTLPAIFG